MGFEMLCLSLNPKRKLCSRHTTIPMYYLKRERETKEYFGKA